MGRAFGDKQELRNQSISSWLKSKRGGSPEEVCPEQTVPAVEVDEVLTRSTVPPKLALKFFTERKIAFKMDY